MKPCINPKCKRDFQPITNQKVCDSKKCRNWLYAERMKRHRKKKKEEYQKSIILSTVQDKEPISLYDLGKILNYDTPTILRHLTKLSKNCEIDQKFEYYTNSYKNWVPLSPDVFHLDYLRIVIAPSHPNIEYHFREYLRAEGLTIDKNNYIKYQNMDLRTAVLKCNRAYACAWANLLSFRLWDQLHMEKGPHNELISFFLHTFSRLCSSSVPIPRSWGLEEISEETSNVHYDSWYAPLFCHLLTAEYVAIQIQHSEKVHHRVINLEKIGDIREKKDGDFKIIDREDVSNVLKRLHEHLKPQIDAGNSEFQEKSTEMDEKEREYYTLKYKDLKGLLGELFSYSNNKDACKRICHAVRRTIEFHGEPFLPIEQIQ